MMLLGAFYLLPAFMRLCYELGGESAVAVREAESGHFPPDRKRIAPRPPGDSGNLDNFEAAPARQSRGAGQKFGVTPTAVNWKYHRPNWDGISAYSFR